MGFQDDNQAAVLRIKLITQKYDHHELLLMKQMNAYHIPFNNINSFMSPGSGTARVERGAP